MTVNTKWLPLATLGIGLVGGWLLSALLRPATAVIEFNKDATAMVVNNSTYRFSEFPADLQQSVHGAFLQASNVFRLAAEDFAARLLVSGGKVNGFDWEQHLQDKITEAELRKTWETVPGFKSLGTFEQTRDKLVDFVVRRLKEQEIGVQKAKVVKENALQLRWNLPLGAPLGTTVSNYPVVEIGPEGKSVAGEFEVVFSYNQRNSDGAFLILDRIAQELQKRIRIRLVAEYEGTSKEKLAIELVSCMASEASRSADAWIVHNRMLQEIPSLSATTKELDVKYYFGGRPELLSAVQNCKTKAMDEKLFRDNTKVWQPLRSNTLPMIFHKSLRVSEYDPRGIELALREQVM